MERDPLRATRSVSWALDDYFDATIRGLQDLATSEHPGTGVGHGVFYFALPSA